MKENETYDETSFQNQQTSLRLQKKLLENYFDFMILMFKDAKKTFMLKHLYVINFFDIYFREMDQFFLDIDCQ